MESHVGPTCLRAQLKRGLLEIRVDAAALPPANLFGFAERRNPKRAFLFVSKVLGRHIPVRPSIMAASFERLAAGIPADLPGPVLVIGMAETAVGLGAGVHRAYRAGRPDSVYLTSTRHPLGTRVFARFEEEHSHASAHLIHWPVDPEIRDLMLKARSLILVDDEASTGKTFLNLHRALVAAGLSNVERVVTCVLTDWTAGAARHAIGEPVTAVSLLTGSYQFHEDQSAPSRICRTSAPFPWANGRSPRNDWGRLGVREVDDTLAPDVQVRPGEKSLSSVPASSSGVLFCWRNAWSDLARMSTSARPRGPHRPGPRDRARAVVPRQLRPRYSELPLQREARPVRPGPDLHGNARSGTRRGTRRCTERRGDCR